MTMRPKRMLYLPHEEKHGKLLKTWIFVLFLPLFCYIPVPARYQEGFEASVDFLYSHIILEVL